MEERKDDKINEPIYLEGEKPLRPWLEIDGHRITINVGHPVSRITSIGYTWGIYVPKFVRQLLSERGFNKGDKIVWKSFRELDDRRIEICIVVEKS